MPEKMERALRKECKKKGYKKKRCDRYVYGAMRRRGWKPKRERS